ncbi:cell wall hydrolase [Brevundimonas sp. AJA228-03]|uniref:cell wall hydrolase n=1 Tax=Brevundimonas sp. AJA228-03 TaxID=2752515 RepID=UPI001AE06AB4|nr:cell wall hydrolase [Brevundimonas sp. AJA228-03]QTN19336.1 cell wall hydrolase [Brevundimonas sp. AJA228-03]
MTPSFASPIDWKRVTTRARRYAAALPAALAALGVAMAAGSTARSDADRTAEAVARVTEGDLSARGLAALSSRMDRAQLALAIRFDPNDRHPALLGLTPGWESLTLAGKPSLELGTNGLQAQRLNAAMPADRGALREARPFVFHTASEADRQRALRCLTQGVYYEAALESTEGQAAVAQVILNRVRDPNYPDTICGVVFEGAERTTGCQFSFTCDGALAQAPVSWAWNRARSVAERALAGHVAEKVGTATHYHADYVHPWWSPTLAKITQIGAHIFYRWKGIYGETAAFKQRYAGREPVIDEARFSRPRFVAPPTLLAGGDLDAADAAVLANGGASLRTVEINGHTRVVGVASLGGRRPATAEEIAAINARLAAFEAPAIASAPPAPPPVGVTRMDVEEVGRPVG